MILAMAYRQRISISLPFALGWSALIVITILGLVGSAAYLAYAFPAWVQWGLLASPLAIYAKKPILDWQPLIFSVSSWWYVAVQALVATPYVTVLFKAQTDELLRAPWTALPSWIFGLYALNIIWLIVTLYRASNLQIKMASTIMVMFLHSAIILFVYQIGFGFDPFVHRATMSWINDFGVIFPKQPYYIGQYVLTILAQTATGLSIHTLDRWLMPLLGSIFLPIVSISSIAPYLKKSTHISWFWSFWIIPLYAFISYGVTVPYIFSVFFTLVAIFAAIASRTNSLSRFVSWIAIILAAITQPLIATPTIAWLFFVTVFPRHQAKHRWIYVIVLAGIIGLTVPAIFTLQALRVGSGFPLLTNPLTTLPEFLAIFARPYWYLPERSSLILEGLYLWQRLLAPLIGIIGLIGIWLMRKHPYRDIAFMSLSGVLGVWITAWLLRSWFVFPGVITYEQINYPTRLLVTSVLFVFPWAMISIQHLTQWFWQHKQAVIARTIFITGVTSLLVVSLYLSYPQRNHKARYPGYNVTRYDIEAVQWIDAQEDTDQYLVLANQIVSAAALQELRFRTYFDTPQGELYQYPIPTGGPLYQFYGPMLYDDNKQETIQKAMTLVDVDSAYVVVNGYWGNLHEIVYELSQVADVTHMIGSGHVWVFGFER